ncbi:hypothetical protein AX17_003059 [Amanita inopinata Kibby_2008]|nr:hypothetical protein AX17_003059 [Amanita inopinata Kibby_2008]
MGVSPLLILYATETGNAQDVADIIARQCRRVSLSARIMSIDTYPLADLVAEELVIFIISTTGSGQEPRSMTPFWNMLLRSDLPVDLFEDMTFTVFGLGDTAYEKFCWPAKILCRRLLSLGAIELCERGEGDDQHQLGIDGALIPWIDRLLDALLPYSPLSSRTTVPPPPAVPPPRVTLRLAEHADQPKDRKPFADWSSSNQSYYHAKVKSNKRITASDWYQDVRHLQLDFDENIRYSPGDIAVIHPIADPQDVDSFLDELHWRGCADDYQTLPPDLPRITTLRELFTRFLCFNAVPRRTFFQYLRYFTKDELEAERLDEFLSPNGADDLYDYCFRVKRTVREVLSEFRHVDIPLDYIFDVFPSLRPRQFSIASSVKRHPNEVHLCVAIVKYRTKLKVPRRGVCTSYMSQLQPGDELLVGIQKGFFKLPPDRGTPVICIGPGTGVAPMRSIIEERIHDGSSSNVLYFGCRSASKDHHYGVEWMAYAESQRIIYRTAFSRDVPEGTKRIYVQDLMQKDAEVIWRFIGEFGAWVYISGSSNKMPTAVKNAIRDAIQQFGKYSLEDASKYVDSMIQEVMEAPKTIKKRKITDRTVPNAILQNPDFAQDSKMYQDLLEMERKLDWNMMRKKVEVQDALSKTPTTTRTLRIFLSHTVSGQIWQTGDVAQTANFETGEGIPAWSFRVEGRLLELLNQRSRDKTPPRKFSTLIKRMVIELDRDPSLYPDGNIVEWPRAPGHHNPVLDGFTVRRTGDSPTRIRVVMYLEHFPEQYKVLPELGNILGIKEESRIGVIQALWNYVKLQNLQDKADRRQVKADEKLLPIFNSEMVYFQNLPEIVNRYLAAPDPIVLHYTLNPAAPPPERPSAWDVEIKMEDTSMKNKMAVMVNPSKESIETVAKLDDEIALLAQSLHNSHVKRTFLQSFANDPANFIQTWLESQSRDLETILGSGPTEGMTIRQEDLRRSEFFRLPWVEEAVAIQEGMRLASKGMQ